MDLGAVVLEEVRPLLIVLLRVFGFWYLRYQAVSTKRLLSYQRLLPGVLTLAIEVDALAVTVSKHIGCSRLVSDSAH